MKYGVEAITCYLHACRQQNESKSRKYLAKVIYSISSFFFFFFFFLQLFFTFYNYFLQVLWLLTYDDDQLQLAESVDKYMTGVPPIQWLPWIPQLLTCLVRLEGKPLLNLLSQVRWKLYSVYFAFYPFIFCLVIFIYAI